MRRLIVNADDCNLTPGVTRAILACHDRGILTSTTFMINLPVESSTVKALKMRPRLGVGIHLNVTLGHPVCAAREVRSLVSPVGKFRKVNEQTISLPGAADLAREYTAQVTRFIKVFGRRPTHLDTHHQVHDHPFFLGVLSKVARHFRLPVRRAVPMRDPRLRRSVVTTDYLFGNLTPQGHWTAEPLGTLLAHLPEGTSEIMCHPGKVDNDLRAISSFTDGRAEELRLFSSPAYRRRLQSMAVRLTHFGCYTHNS
jgi:chitin disaccharide deacetylase